MIQDVRLYINDKLVDFSNELSLPFTYQLEDLKNPTIIKNSFTKTITIIGTKNNNKIFGEIYNLDREQLHDETYIVGSYFNPSFRTPFTLYRNREIIESGYMQLNNVTIKNGVINYNITLYGGLGDFFYNLSYNKENEPLQLKDLDYGEPLDFNIDKQIVKESWQKLNNERASTAKTITDTIAFIPSYNGLYENFDNDKVLINTKNSKVFPYSSTTVDGVKYTPYNGYALGELNNEYSEWEMRSLMSYKQRPALKLSKFIEACCNPKNNGGYEIELDDSFFNHSNPYYYHSYIALPLLEGKIDNDGETIEDNLSVNTNAFVGDKNNSIQSSTTASITVVGSGITMGSNGVINTAGMNNSTMFDIDLDVQLFFKQNGDFIHSGDLYHSISEYIELEEGVYYNIWLHSTVLQVQAIDADRNIVIGQSDYLNFTNKIRAYGADYISKQKDWKNWSNPNNTPIQNVLGKFVYDSSIGKHYFKTNEGGNTIRISLKKCKKADNIRFQLVIKNVCNNMYSSKINCLSKKDFTRTANGIMENVFVAGYWNCAADDKTSKIIISSGDVDITSGQKITQDILLKTEKTPADFLLGYCKLFGLYFSHNITDKKITILKRNNYFTGNIINIQDRIDNSKDFIINPLLYDKKFYRLNLENNSSYVGDKYKNEYGVEYGQKRINTNYNFNSETTDLLKDNVFQNVISMVDNSVYYRTFFNSGGTQEPSFLIDNMNYKTYNKGTSELKETSVEISGAKRIDLSKSVNWNTNHGYDYNDKLCCFSKDEQKSLADLSATLVFFDGVYTPQDLEGNEIQYWLVDDTPEMFELNEKQCHLYTEDEFDANNNWVGWKVPYLPKFSRYLMDNNKIVDSWDFAKPKEIYIPNAIYSDNITLYDQYWDKVYSDKLNINTKKVTCYVNLNGMNVNEYLLKDFYYFYNSYWVLNKIENFDINSHQTTKCEFIKINDITNYTAELGKRYDYFYADETYFKVPHSGGSITTKIHSTTPWKVYQYGISYSKIIDITPVTGDTGTTEITISFTPNTEEYSNTMIYVPLQTLDNSMDSFTIEIDQQPNLDNVVKLSGKIKYLSGSLIPNAVINTYGNNGSVYNSSKLDEYTGEYVLYIPKGIEVGLQVLSMQGYNNVVIWEDTITCNQDTIYNKNIFRL